MYVSLLILDDNLSQSVKDIIHSLKNDNCLLMETNFESSNFEELTTQIQELYTERQVLGDDLDLNNIMFFNSKIEKNDVYMSYYKTEGKKILYNPHDYDNNFESWNTIKTFITYCIENFSSIENIDFFDINQLFYYKPWNEVYNNLLINDDISGSSIKIGFISNDFKELDDSIYYSFDDTNDIVNKTKSLSKSSNWLYDIFTNFKSQNSNVEHIFNTYFVMNDNNLNLLNSSSLFSLDFDPSKLELNNSTPYNNFLNILLVPLVNEYQRDDFPKLLKQLYQASNTCVIFLTDNETQQSLGLKVTRMITNYVGDYYKTFTTTMDESGNIQTIEGVKENIEMRLGVYLPPYWNDSSSPSREIKLSNNLTTISLDVSESQDVLSENILSSLVTLINTNFDYVNKIYFEIFNMNQNYNQSLDIIYTKLSEIESYQNKVAFYYSSFIQLDNDNNTIFWGNDKIVNTKIYNNIYYENGEKCYYYNEHNHNITLYLCSGNDNMADISPYIEKNKIHNFVLYDLDLDDSPENSKMYDVQKTLTPNTLIIPFNSNDNEESYERVISVIKNLASDSNVVLKNVSIFQDFIEDSETYSLFNNENIHQLKDVSLNDPELETWSEFKTFVLTLQNDLGVENLDLLMCKIYSDENWKFVLNKLETELTTLNIRSSDDNTGHIMFDGDWVLESEGVDVNMIRVYFTEQIKKLEIVLGTGGSQYTTVAIGKDQQSLYCVGKGINDNQANGWDGTNRSWYRKVDLYSSSGVSYGDSFYILEEGEKIIQLSNIPPNTSSGGFFILTSKNKLYAFGGDGLSSTYASLGLGDHSDLPSSAVGNSSLIKFPLLCKFQDGEDIYKKKKFRSIHTARETVYVLFDDGDIYCCGTNTLVLNGTWNNILGYNSLLSGKSHINYFVKYEEPNKEYLFGEADEIPVRMCGGRSSMLILTNKNKLYSQGYSNNGYGSQTGRGGPNRKDDIGLVLFDDALNTDEYVVHFCSGAAISACLTNQGRIFTCGDNFQTPLAQNTTNRGAFKKMNLIHNYQNYDTEKTVRQMFTGTQTFFVLFDDNTLWTSGDGGNNQTRNLHGSDTRVLTIVNNGRFGGHTTEQRVSFNLATHSMIGITDTGKLWSWGYNKYLTLGSKSTSTTQKWTTPAQSYLGNTNNRVTDALFAAHHHENVMMDEFNTIIEQIEFATSYKIPLIEDLIISQDLSGNYVYHPNSSEGDEYNTDVSYALNVGIFKIKNVPSSTPLAILNSGQTDKISYFGTTEETVNTSSNIVDIYVSSGSTSSPYYTFYTDSNGNNELSGNTLYLNRSYRFNRLNSATSHAFYISDAGYGNASTTIDISGDGTPTSGITGSQSFTVDFNGLANSATLTFYCTVHSSMVGTFTLADSDGYTSPSVDLTGYKFYSGDVYIKVDESFNDLSLYTTGYGGSYLGTEGKIYFDPEVTYDGYSVDIASSTTNSFPFTTFFNAYQDTNNSFIAVFSETDEISGNIANTFEIIAGGTYTIKGIPEEFSLAIVESGTSNIDISGDSSKLNNYTVNGVSTPFYHGELQFTVPSYGFNKLNMYVYDTVGAVLHKVNGEAFKDQLQLEYIVTENKATSSKWTANYVASGTNEITMNSSFSLGTDTSGNKYYKMTGHTPIQPNYPDYQHILDIDADADNAGFMWETWVYPENNLTNNLGNNQNALMSIDSGSGGPHFFVNLQDSRGDGNIGMAPSVYKTYEGLNDNPGDINDYVGEMIHLIGYMYPETTTDYNRGVYVNGVHYPQLSTGDTGQSGVPSFDSIQNNFSVGAGLESTGQSCVNLRFYSLRVWHRQLSSSEITTLYNAGPKASTLTDINDYTMKFNPINIIIDASSSVIRELSYSSHFIIYPKSSTEVYVQLNEVDELSGNFTDTFKVVTNGIYEIKNIPEKYILNITEVDTSFVEITGTDASMSTYSFGDVSYNFYHGNMYLKVQDNTEDICLNMMVYDTDNDISYNLGTQITISKNIVDVFNPPSNDLSGLQFEYIVNADKATTTEWSANYVKDGSNKISILDNYTLSSDTNGYYYNMSSGNSTLSVNIPDADYYKEVDTVGNPGIMFEIWLKSTDTVSGRGFIMSADTGYGPVLQLNLGGGIGMGSSDSDSYTNLTNPGTINSSSNQNTLLHIVGYIYPNSNASDFNRGVYINGTHYEQESFAQSGLSGNPSFDTSESVLSLFGLNDNDTNRADNINVYSVRLWHQQLTSSQISTLYNAGPQASTLTTTPTKVNRGSGGGLPEGIINFKYQPFDYTLSGNENFYCVGATKVHGYMRTETARTIYTEESSSSWNWARLQFVLFDKANNYRFTPGTLSNSVAGSSSTTVLYFEESGNYSPGKYGWTTTTNKASLESSYDHFMIVGPTGQTNSYYYQDNGTPKYNPNWNMSYYSGNGASNVYSDIFALSLDEELTEDSLLFPIQHIWNGNNHSPKNAKWMVGFTTNTSHISSDSKRYYDWNEKMKELVSGKSNGASVWGSDQLIYLYALKFNTESYISNFASTASTTKLCLTLDVPESIETVGPYNVLDLHPTISKKTYIQTVDFGMAKDQTYVIEAPEDYPLAFVGSKNQTDISYIGYEENKQGQVIVNDVSYDLYSGPLFIQLNDDISASNEFTFYTNDGVDLNTTNKMFYDASCGVSFNTDTSYNLPESNDYKYNVKFLRKIDESGPKLYSYTPGNTGHSLLSTTRGTSLQTIEHYARGNYLISHHTGTSGKQYSYYFNSFAYLSESEAGTWNIGLRNTDDCYASLYVMEGNYAWADFTKYHESTTVIGADASPWTGGRVTDGVSIYTISEFMEQMNTDYPDANITKLVEINRSKSTQENGTFEFQANKPYSILMYWRHDSGSTGTSHVSCRIAAWKQGESAVSLPATGTSGSRTGSGSITDPYITTAGDQLPSWFYSSISSVEEVLDPNATDKYILYPRFDLPKSNDKVEGITADISGDELEITEDSFYKNISLKLYKGYQYSFNQIPTWYPITLLNNGLGGKISITGDEDKRIDGYYRVEVSGNDSYTTTETDSSGNVKYYNDTSYNFYYGDVKINVYDNFDDREPVVTQTVYPSKFKYIFFKCSTVDYFNIHEIECWINNSNIAASSNGASATFTLTDDITSTNNAPHHSAYPASKSINGNTENVTTNTTLGDTGNKYNSLLITLDDEYDATDLQRIIVYNRYDGSNKSFVTTRYRCVDYFQLLDSSGDVLIQIDHSDSTSSTFDNIQYINYIGPDDSNGTSYTKYTSLSSNFSFDTGGIGTITTTTYPPKGLTLYSTYNGGTVVGNELMVRYDEDRINSTGKEVLKQISSINVVDDDNGDKKYVFNSRNLFINNITYGIHIGTYVFTDIPENYAMAVMNNGIEDIIEYTGHTKKGDFTGPDGNSYSFYYESLTMQVKTLTGLDDISFSICSYNNGYMGGEGIFVGMNEHNYNIMEHDKDFETYKGANIESGFLSDDIMDSLQTEFVAGTSSTWTANYMKLGSNGSTTFTNQADLVQGSDSDGYYFRVNTTNRGAYLNNYPNQGELLLMDTDGTPGFTFEIWFKSPVAPSTDRGWLMCMETGWGPCIAINDARIGGIGTTPGASDNNTYTNLTSPGYANGDNLNKLYHVVGYWKRNGNYFDRGVYVNGVHYPQENTSTSGNADRPTLDNISRKFGIGNLQGTTGHHCNGTYVYGFRIWHKKLEQEHVTKLYNKGCNGSIVESDYVAPFPQINFKYQPFDYTYSANSNYYVKGAKLARGNIKVDDFSAYTDYTTTADRYVHRLMFSLENAHNGSRWTPNTNSAHILTFVDYGDNLTRDTGNANASNETLSAMYEYYMKVSATGSAATIGLIFEDASGNPTDGYPSGTIMNTWHQNYTSIYSHRFALSTDASLNEDSILYPIHYVQNGNDWNGGSRWLFTTYYYTNEKLGTDKGRHSDWNAQLASSNSMLATGTNVYLYALDLGEEPSSSGSGDIKLLPSIVEYTDSSGVDVSFSNPVTYLSNSVEPIAQGKFKYIYIIADSTYNTMVIREFQCFVNGTNVALSSGGANAVWTKTDINTTTGSAHNLGGSSVAIDGTITKDGTQSNVAHGNGPNGWTRLLITLPETYDVNDLQRAVVHLRHLSANYDHYSGVGGKSIGKVQLLDEDKSTVVVEWDNTSSTYNGSETNPQGTYVGIFEINFLGPADDPNTTDFTIYDGSDTADLSMTTVTYNENPNYKTKYTYYTECLINDASVNIITTGPSGESVPLFNNDISFEEYKVYSVYDGSYNISVDASDAIALLNYDVSNAISYTGTTLVNTKPSVYDIANTYNYYSGTVTITVESSFNDVLIFEHLDASGIDNKFSKLMYSETCNPNILKKPVTEQEIESSIVCLDATNIVNIINSEGNKYVLNGLSDYSSSRIYGVYQGNYEIRNIPVAHPMAILNNDVSDNVIYSGSELYATKEVDGISYNFYVGNLDITVMDRFTGRLSLYCYNHGYMGGKDVIKYTTTCGTDSVGYYVDCLDTQNNINVVGSKYLFNNDTEYDDERKYGLYTRLYTIKNVPENHPIAFLNNDVSNVVNYYGNSLYDIKEVDGIKYNFYTGTVTLDITGSFDSFLSVYCYNHGYMGGQDLFKYSTICDYDLANVKPRVVEEVQINKQCLLTSSSYKVLFDSNNEEKIVLNYGTNTSYDSTLHYGLDVGNYIITNIPDSHPMAIINGEVSDKITYTGEKLMLRKRNTNDNRMYNYYSGYIRLDVKSIPTNVNSLSFSSSYSTNMYEQGKFIFDNTCSLNDNFYSCLPTYSTVELSNNNILINNTDYNDSGDSKIALYTRYYQFTSVPKDNPIGFISISNEEHIYYHGLELNKTTIALDPSTNIDLYSGTVTLGILDDFGYDLRMIMKQTNSNNYSDISMYYTDYCVYEGSQDNLTPTIKCINFNTTGNYTLDNGYGRLLINDTLPNYSRIYGFNIGLYKITIEEYTNAIRIVNTNINNNDIFLSVVDDENIINYTKTIDGVDISYDYYYGDVLLHVTTDVSYLDTGLIFDFANVNDYSSDNNIIFTSECLTNESVYTQCLDISSSISISNEYIILNNNDEYSSTTKFGLYVGDYYLNDIPSTNPIAILNNDISNNITYQGTTLYGTKDISGISYKFYTGSIRITVKGIFGRVSLYEYNNGFMGGEDILRYSELCDYVSQGFFTNPVNTVVSFNNRDSRRRILLTDSTEYNEFERPAYFVGTYTITDIPENNPVAVINSGLENAIGYTGTDLSGNYEVGDNFYNFYCGTLTIYIFEPFTNITIEDPDTFISLYSYNDGFMGTEEKLCYDNRISSYTDLSYTICVNSNSDIKMYNNPDESPDSSFNYTFNNAGEFYDYKIMGMHVGNYRLVNIPISDPIALLNVDVSNLITYTGKSSNKVTAFGPDGTTNYDFYYGNIDIEVIGDFGSLSAYSANGYYAGAQDVFKFTDYCETVGYVVECLTLETSMNIYDGNFTFNGGIYNSYKKFGLTEGSYSIKNIPASQAVTFLNNDISNNVIISGDSIDLCGNFAGPDGNNYNYYTNEINITIKNKFDGYLPLYSYTDQSYNNGEELFVYSDLCTFINKHKMHTYCLSNSSTNDVSYATNDSSKIILDSTLKTFDSKRNYGVYLGNYIFNIPQETPIAFLNNSVKTLVTYSGSESNKIRKSGPRGEAIYDYYHGKVVLNVLGDFGELDYHFLNKGFLGGLDNVIVYTDFCNDGVTNKAIECLTKTTRMNLIDNSGSYLYTFNSNTISNSNRTFGLHEGMYTITDICDNYPIAIMNNGLTQYIDYTGSEQDLCGNFTASDGNNYNFYKNEITLVVNSDFTQNGNISIFSYGSDLSGNFGLENKLTYSDLCEDTTTQEYEQVNDDIVSLDFYLLQASTY